MSRVACAFILCHGRPTYVPTLDTLERCNYTGDWRIVVDDEDPDRDGYLKRFGEDRVVTFHKKDYDHVDMGDNFPSRVSAVQARVACWDIAREMGVTHFLELDDDYRGMMFRWADGPLLRSRQVRNADAVFGAMWDWLDASGAKAVALAQTGDVIGGASCSNWRQKLLRKCMNTWFVRTDRPISFAGRMNDDVAAYTLGSTRGDLFFTTVYAMILADRTQQVPGGMSEEYLQKGTYVKSFYALMMCPSAVKVSVMESKYPRIHHEVVKRFCYPMILPESVRKAPGHTADPQSVHPGP